MRKLWPVLITLACMVRCSRGGATSSFQVKGTYAALTTTQTCTDGNTITLVAVSFSTAYDNAFLSNPANACVWPANNSSYSVYLLAFGANPAPFAPGSYQIHVDDSGGCVAFVTQRDAACTQLLPNVVATSGALQLTAVGSDRVAGRVDLVFGDGRTAADTFDAPVIATAANPCAMLGVGGGNGIETTPPGLVGPLIAPRGGCAAITCQP